MPNRQRPGATYANTPATAAFLDRNRDSYMGGLLEMANRRLYQFWGNLEEGLLTGLPQNESKDGNMHFFEQLYENPEALREFVAAMSGFQGGNFTALISAFDFSKYRTVADLGGADGFCAARSRSITPRSRARPTICRR